MLITFAGVIGGTGAFRCLYIQIFFVILHSQFIKSCPIMNHTLHSIYTSCPSVKNWGYLENWKSTASAMMSL